MTVEFLKYNPDTYDGLRVEVIYLAGNKNQAMWWSVAFISDAIST